MVWRERGHVRNAEKAYSNKHSRQEEDSQKCNGSHGSAVLFRRFCYLDVRATILLGDDGIDL